MKKKDEPLVRLSLTLVLLLPTILNRELSIREWSDWLMSHVLFFWGGNYAKNLPGALSLAKKEGGVIMQYNYRRPTRCP